MALRSIVNNEGVAPLDAQNRLRRGIFDHMHAYCKQHGIAPPKDMIDIGCSVGEAGGLFFGFSSWKLSWGFI